MERMQVRLLQRDFSPTAEPIWRLEVERLIWSAVGGPAEAVITGRVAQNDESYLAQIAMDGLRRPVEVTNQAGEKVWWGFIQRVEVWVNGWCLAYDLADVTNRVCVQYSQPEPQLEWTGMRTFTGWADDPASQQAFGVRERIFTYGSISAGEAEQARDSILASRCQPHGHVTSQPDFRKAAQVRLICRGWWETLQWRIARFNDGYSGFVKPGLSTQSFGRNATTDARVAQSFSTGYGGWKCGEAVVNIRATGSVTDQVVCEICADNGGMPGNVLGSAAVNASLIANVRWWVKFIFDPKVSINANTPYWLIFSRSGALNSTNYYLLYTDPGNCYPQGKLMTWNGSTWLDVSSGTTDINFYTAGYTTRLARLAELAGSDLGGQFLTGFQADAVITGDTLLRRDGIWDCQKEFLNLLERGDVNGAPLAVRVDEDRRLVVVSQPDEADWRFTVDAGGILRTRSGRLAWCPDNPAGQRVLLATSWLETTPLIETAQWTPREGLVVTW